MEEIKFSEWKNLILKVGKIIEVEDMENADKLYKLKIDLGEEQRTLVAGLKKYYSKEDLQNKKVVVFCNLEPKELRGVESKGMLLAAVNSDESKVRLLEPDGEIELGSRIF